MVPNAPLVLRCRASAWGLPTRLTVCRSTMEAAKHLFIPIGRTAESRSIFPFLTAKPAITLVRLARYQSLCQQWMAMIGPGQPLLQSGTPEGGVKIEESCGTD